MISAEMRDSFCLVIGSMDRRKTLAHALHRCHTPVLPAYTLLKFRQPYVHSALSSSPFALAFAASSG